MKASSPRARRRLSSAHSREGQTAGTLRLRPLRGYDLSPRVESHSILTVDVSVAEQRPTPATKRVVRHGHRDRHIDTDHADFDLALKAARGRAAAGENR